MSTNFHLLNPWFSPEETTSLCSPVLQYESYSNIPCLLRAGSWEYESFSIFNAPFRVFLLYSMKLMLTCFTFSILHPCSLYYLTPWRSDNGFTLSFWLWPLGCSVFSLFCSSLERFICLGQRCEHASWIFHVSHHQFGLVFKNQTKPTNKQTKTGST